MNKRKYKLKRYDKNRNSYRINVLLVYLTIILSISQIFNIAYNITSNLYDTVNEFLRKTFMYVLVEFPLVIISMYITIISIYCILKIIHSKFIADKYNLRKKYNNDKIMITKY